MWNKRKEEEYPPKSAPSPAPSASPKESYQTVTPTPTPSFHTADRGLAIIGRSVMIKGQIISREDLTIDGEVEGSIELQEHRLTIGPNGRVQAGIRAREIVVLGSVHGNVETSDKLEIRKDAKLIGDIKTARVVIEDGAYFKGSIDIIKPEAPAPKPAAHAKQATAPASASSAAPTPVQATISDAKR